ncbi:hypothetical protein E2C01_095439 [Portunus trituberculatus]|uniref:Uncharacterized protein n=1 Tax=Portunus trituberculatus TaxID=210409 RepID=A0A5B7JV95_PORTR|nr:hypothetical protein [Portunus trituberculatus]
MATDGLVQLQGGIMCVNMQLEMLTTRSINKALLAGIHSHLVPEKYSYKKSVHLNKRLYTIVIKLNNHKYAILASNSTLQRGK